MGTARSIIARHRLFAALIVAVALFLKLTVPAGFMPVADGSGIHVVFCSGQGPMAMAPGMAMPDAMHHDGRGDHDRSRVDAPCGFDGMSAPSMAVPEAPLIAAAIAFVMATVFRARPSGLRRIAPRLRPRLRDPPALA